MPLFEYRCQCCGEVFEHLERTRTSASGSPVTTPVTCPRCQSAEVERLLSTFSRRAGNSAAPLPGGG